MAEENGTAGMKNPPEKYKITLRVEASDDTFEFKFADAEASAHLEAVMDEIKRTDILAPDYGNPGITALVKAFEYFTCGIGEDPYKDQGKEGGNG